MSSMGMGQIEIDGRGGSGTCDEPSKHSHSHFYVAILLPRRLLPYCLLADHCVGEDTALGA